MSKFWFIISLIVLAVIVVMALGLFGDFNNSEQTASLAYMSILGLAICSGLLAKNIKMKDFLRNAIIWVAIIFALIFGYNMRYELQDLLNKLSAGTIPASPVTRITEDGTTVTIDRSQNGHYMVNALLNNQQIHMLIDTGAYSVILTYEDALSIGIDVINLKYTVPINTANGTTYAAPAMIDSIKIGDIERRNVPTLVSAKNNLSDSLLGMNFLNRLSGYSVRGDRFILID